MCDLVGIGEVCTMAPFVVASTDIECYSPAWGETFVGNGDRVNVNLTRNGGFVDFTRGGTSAVECNSSIACLSPASPPGRDAKRSY